MWMHQVTAEYMVMGKPPLFQNKYSLLVKDHLSYGGAK